MKVTKIKVGSRYETKFGVGACMIAGPHHVWVYIDGQTKEMAPRHVWKELPSGAQP